MGDEGHVIRCFVLELVFVLGSFGSVMLDLWLGCFASRLRHVAVFGESTDFIASLTIYIVFSVDCREIARRIEWHEQSLALDAFIKWLSSFLRRWTAASIPREGGVKVLRAIHRLHDVLGVLELNRGSFDLILF